MLQRQFENSGFGDGAVKLQSDAENQLITRQCKASPSLPVTVPVGKQEDTKASVRVQLPLLAELSPHQHSLLSHWQHVNCRKEGTAVVPWRGKGCLEHQQKQGIQRWGTLSQSVPLLKKSCKQ